MVTGLDLEGFKVSQNTIKGRSRLDVDHRVNPEKKRQVNDN